MISGFAILLLCQLLGEVTARGLGLPVPGPVLGLTLLLGGLGLANRLRPFSPAILNGSPLGRAADGLLANLALLFVPAGAGVVQYLGLIGQNGLALGIAIVGSTLATLLATVSTFLLVKRVTRPAGGGV